eukprot:scaffold423221_cov19-Prasinocladus_malaysianus.AAC.1
MSSSSSLPLSACEPYTIACRHRAAKARIQCDMLKRTHISLANLHQRTFISALSLPYEPSFGSKAQSFGAENSKKFGKLCVGKTAMDVTC